MPKKTKSKDSIKITANINENEFMGLFTTTVTRIVQEEMRPVKAIIERYKKENEQLKARIDKLKKK